MPCPFKVHCFTCLMIVNISALEKVPMVLVPTFYFIGEICLAIWLIKSVDEVCHCLIALNYLRK